LKFKVNRAIINSKDGSLKIIFFRRLNTMAYKIDADTCISCGACAAECPVSAISEGDSAYVIDADTCVECGACAGTCPVGAPAAE
jgi:ferredoxin